MIFIIGGAGSGQAEYAAGNCPGAQVIGDYHLLVKKQLEEGKDPLAEAEKLLREQRAETGQILKESRAETGQTLKESRVETGQILIETEPETGRLLQECGKSRELKCPELVIWSCEIGCGLVPMDPFERKWREISGRVNCLLAREADRVVRTICGRGCIIKGLEKAVKPDVISDMPENDAETASTACMHGTAKDTETFWKEKSGVEISSVSAVKSRAKSVMITGTMSNAGKSFITAGLCRIFAGDGYSVAPFKAQNMALNSFITKQGEEMGRSQVVQAEACGKEPDARMNPILLKPTTDKGSQVIVLGHPVGNMDAKEYYRHKKEFIPYVRQAYESLAAENDIIVLEGAGSPAEINLKENDIVNMPMAEMADAPVILVGNIDPGGVFAQLYGTVKLLDEDEQARIKGLIINKFRGDLSILEPGIAMLEEKTGKPVLGVLPYTDVRLEPEDSLAMEEAEKPVKRLRESLNRDTGEGYPEEAEKPVKRLRESLNCDTGEGYPEEEPGRRISCTGNDLDIAVIRFPKISNFTDFEALRFESGVRVRYVSSARELGTPDAVILPGTKSTIRDLIWLRENGLETAVRRAYEKGAFLFGICGGYQMLGGKITDPDGAEMTGEINGLGYLDMETVFMQEKIMCQTETISGFGIPELDGKKIRGYEVHMGRKAGPGTGVSEAAWDSSAEGKSRDPDHDAARANPAQNVTGTYIHGIFDEEEFREAFLSFLIRRRGGGRHISDDENKMTYREYKEKQIADLAEMLRKQLDIKAIYRMMGIG